MPKSWSKVHVEETGKYHIRMHHDGEEQDLSFEFNSEKEADAAIEDFKKAPTNSKPIPRPKSW